MDLIELALDVELETVDPEVLELQKQYRNRIFMIMRF